MSPVEGRRWPGLYLHQNQFWHARVAPNPGISGTRPKLTKLTETAGRRKHVIILERIVGTATAGLLSAGWTVFLPEPKVR